MRISDWSSDVCSSDLQGLLVREPADKQFTIGPRLNALAIGTVAASVRRAPRHAILEALARETGETCNLGMLDGNAVLYLDRVETHWPLRLQLSVGSHVPLHCTAMGRSEEHTSELQSLMRISYAVFCLTKK